jgi:acetyl-CoA synthetase
MQYPKTHASQHQPSASGAAARADSPTYEEVVSTFSWDEVIAQCDWPIHAKHNCAHELCDRWADHAATADRIALRYETADGQRGAYTYREVQDLANRCANALAALGVSRGDRVAGLLSKQPAVLPTVLGVWKLGAVYVPIFTAFAPPAIAFRLRQSGACAVVTDATSLPKLREAQTLGEGLPALRHTLVVGDETATFDHAHNFWAALHAASPAFTTVETTQDELAAIQYTSGSTGEPKGAMLRHGGFVTLLPFLRYGLDLRVDDVFWGMADPGWSYGLFVCVLGPLALGAASLLIEAPFTPATCWEVLERYGVTNLATAPTAYRALAAAGVDLARQHPVQLRVATSAGEPLNPAVYEWFRRELGIVIHDTYGQTETAITVANYPSLRWTIKPGSMGRPLPGFEVAVIDAHGSEVPTDVVGQIAVRRTDVVMRAFGYWQAPEKTVAGFLGEWWLTGDLARRDADGYVWFEGRADDVINTSGYRIGPLEIESALLTHPAVTESAVIGVPDAQRGVAIKVFVVLKPGHEGSAALVEALQQLVRDHVGTHAFPRAVAFVTSLPKTESGKLQRYLLRQREQQVTSE